ncbi:DNA-binding protein [Bacillus canaveralius]|uniref:DNA-binding protein n=1 Tax=Bacillus canaveralius TaxID=1403243 RepID=A0A2N5GQS6_9BACI|nr:MULTISPECIES: DNA-binding protein [Bacillus]PLR85587.1 DNA-binding protein [Bacillus canaveralius]PLR86425.1 DNA-binding protein [Bacillus sp. V33-4]PLR94752.1 DNA-binding protein [Bacillus canaveralius]RSK54712.1 DNA-binding protein [Bacillus canaveralius]
MKLGSEQRPIIVKVQTDEKIGTITKICKHFGWRFIIGIEPMEDLTDLRAALKDALTPGDVYSLCPCGSEKNISFAAEKNEKL